jgi:putative transposase
LSLQEEAIELAIKEMRKKAGPLRVIDLLEAVAAHRRLASVPCPSRSTIDRRLKRASGIQVHRRGVAAPGTAYTKISPSAFVVDDLYRQPLGKPYLTLATDVATRCIVGFVISFVPPSAGTVSPKAD